MPEYPEARWLSLSEAADLFSDAANPPQAFGWLLATGEVRIRGKRLDHPDPEAIEDRLRRANAAPAFEISIRPDANEITLSLSWIARNMLGYGDLAPEPLIEAQLADVFGAAQWREYWRSGLTFGDVLVSAASLFDAMAGSGYMLPEPAEAEIPIRPAGYIPAWIPFAEAQNYVQKIAGCTRRDARDALVMALQDSRIASRDSDTGEEIDARNWFRAMFIGPEPLLGAGRDGEIRRVELHREDIEKLWRDPTGAPPEKEPLRPAPESEIHRAIGEAYEAAAVAGEKPPNLKEIVAPVQVILRRTGFEASGMRIQELASDPRHSGRRRKRGKTVASENRQKSG